MHSLLRRIFAACGVVTFAAMLAIAGPARNASAEAAAPDCKPSGAKVTEVYKSGDPTKKENAADIGNKIVVVLDKPAEFLAQMTCLKKDAVLYIDGRATGNKLAVPVTDPHNGLAFFLRATGASRDFWTAQFGRPDFDPRPIKVTVGIEDQQPLPSEKKLDLIVLPPWWLLFWLALFIVLVVGFFKIARNSTILRDPVLDTDTPNVLGAYSLSKVQGAWWFFIIVASYLLIGIVTGDFSNSITSTALILLGIGAGTVVGSAAIDASKLEQRKAELVAEKKVLATAKAAANADDEKKSQAKIDALSGKSTGDFLKDILSDGNGVNFHRFQLAAWTLVLSIIFIKEVYIDLAMPTFNQTLMGLIGLSAGTYLGLKIPEPTKPTT